MRLLDARTAGDAVRLVVFMVVTALLTAMLVVTIGNLTFTGEEEYQAVFSDVTGVNTGDDVRIAGVKVGTVEGIEIKDRTRAVLTFTVDEEQQLEQSTEARLRYRDLVGRRYLALAPGTGESGVLDPGSTIPMEQTHPALDLTVLFNGFKPLFTALNPDDVNRLSHEIIQVFQGEGGTVESLLSHTASITNTLAGRDRVIGELIDNLNDVLTMLGDRDDELTALIKEFQQFVTRLSQDRTPILNSLDSISELATNTSDLVSDARPWLTRDLQQLRRVTKVLDDHKQVVDQTLQILPMKLQKIGRTAHYGSYFNFYVCNFQGRVSAGNELSVPVDFHVNTARCDLG